MSLPNFLIYSGIIRPIMMDVPMMARFRVEVKDTGLRLESVTPMNIPIMVISEPPRTGLGMEMKTAESLPKTPRTRYNTPQPTNTLVLAT